MRQVPVLDATPIGIVGDGRLARHFLHYFSLLGLPVRAWSRRASAASPPETIATNLKALEGDPLHAVYSAFVRAHEQRS
jgi:phosphoglycerate dehydrogenase-like enzyme